MSRLPQMSPSTDTGMVYVAKRGNDYKIGFTRRSLARRVRDIGGTLLFTIPTGQRPAQLEYLINHRFAAKRLPPRGDEPGDKREWFALDAADLEWLRGLASFMDETVERESEHNSQFSDAPLPIESTT